MPNQPNYAALDHSITSLILSLDQMGELNSSELREAVVNVMATRLGVDCYVWPKNAETKLQDLIQTITETRAELALAQQNRNLC